MEIGWQYRQSYCKNYLAYFFLAHPVQSLEVACEPTTIAVQVVDNSSCLWFKCQLRPQCSICTAGNIILLRDMERTRTLDRNNK